MEADSNDLPQASEDSTDSTTDHSCLQTSFENYRNGIAPSVTESPINPPKAESFKSRFLRHLQQAKSLPSINPVVRTIFLRVLPWAVPLLLKFIFSGTNVAVCKISSTEVQDANSKHLEQITDCLVLTKVTKSK